jgi:hypothetical protein
MLLFTVFLQLLCAIHFAGPLCSADERSAEA